MKNTKTFCSLRSLNNSSLEMGDHKQTAHGRLSGHRSQLNLSKRGLAFRYGGRPNDLISDSISRLKNGYLRRLDQVSLIDSKETLQLLESLLQCGYIQNYTSLKTFDCVSPVSKMPLSSIGGLSERAQGRVSNKKGSNGSEGPASKDAFINVFLKYHQSLPAIRGIQRLSKPNKRLYFSKNNIIKVSQEQNWGEN